MESNFNNREFEQLVKRNADQYRMIPSEKVWKGINNALHTRRRWYGIGLTMLLLLTAVSVTWVMVSYPVSKKQETNSTQNIQPNTPGPTVADPANPPSNTINGLLSFNKFTEEKAPVNDKTGTQVLNENTLPETSTESLIVGNILENTDVQLITEKASQNTPVKAERSVVPSNFNINNVPAPINGTGTGDKVSANKITERSDKRLTLYKETYYPLTIESVVNTYHAQKIRRKLSWQLYFAPTISYRKLSQNKSFQGASPFDPANYPFASLTDVNKAVVHKPDLGLELGFTTRYPLTKNLRLRGGLQFNINRYDIKAFVYNGEQATINLTGGNGTNSVTAWTYYRNYNGYKTDWLKNFYFTVSAPIGAELTLLGNDKTSLGIAGTVQPTYILSDRAYLISTDYKNYAEVPWLIRHVNVNTSFETFISYKSRSTRWQVGPQVRYQVLSSFQNKYPVKENLFDFGLKIGVTLNQ